MTPSRCFLSAVLMLALTPAALGAAQTAAPAQTASRAAAAPLPQYVRFGAELKDFNGKPATGVVGITFLLYEEERGGSPLWLETQNVTVDEKGHFAVMLGAATPEGLPVELFTAKQARWLAMEPQGLPAPARVMLLSVPYALKAGDAETFGGLSPSAFLREAQAGARPADTQASRSAEAKPALAGAGTAGFVPLWMNSSGTLGNSVLSQSGSGSTARVGIGTGKPAATLDVKGSVIARGALQLPNKLTASAAQGSASQPLTLQASAFSSSSHKAVAPEFQWQAEPHGNNTASPSGTLNLLYSASGAPAETGLSIAGNGRITFAPGQTFPGVGNGTITAVSAGTGLTGGGKSGSVTIGIDPAKVPLLNTANTFMADQTVSGNLSASKLNVNGTANFGGLVTFASGQTFPGAGNGTITAVAAGTGLAGGGSSGGVTLGIDPAKVPLLAAANNFTADQTVTGNLQASATVTGATVNATNGFNLGGNPFALGSYSAFNSFVGFAGNSTATGNNNVGLGRKALLSVGTGHDNTAQGSIALLSNDAGAYNSAFGSSALWATTRGQYNTAIGYEALSLNTTGSNNTAVGANSGPDSTHPNLSNATAIGANATVTASNSLVLGSINGVNDATADTLVGIGTTAPAATLDVHGNANFTGPVTFASGQRFPGTGTITEVKAGTGLKGGGKSGGVELDLDTSYSDGRYAQLSAQNTFAAQQIFNSNVGIGIFPAYPLHVNGSIRAEDGLSVGGNGFLQVDAPGVYGGHLTVTADGLVGIRNPNPKNTLDVSGNISTTFGVEANTVTIGGDTAMSAAPHMVVSGYVPEPINALAVLRPIFMIPSKPILITRMTSNGFNECLGDETYSLYVGSVVNSQTAQYTLTLSSPQGFEDSGPLSIAVSAGTPVWVVSNPAPICPPGPLHLTDVAISVEYVMQ